MVRASLVVLLVKNLPAMQENWVWTLGWQDPLEKGKATHSSILAWENCMDCIVHGVAKNLTQLSNFHSVVRALPLSESSGILTQNAVPCNMP